MAEMTQEKQTITPSNFAKIGPFGAFVVIAVSCCLAMVVLGIIVAGIVNRWSTFTGDCLFAMSAMVACPALLGVGVAFFVAKTANLQPKGFDRLD
jgi:hypothetical protein